MSIPTPNAAVSPERLNARLWIAVAVPLGILLSLGIFLEQQLLAMADDMRWVEHSILVISSANETLKEIIDQETGERGYLVTGDKLYLEPFERAHPRDGFQKLDTLVTDRAAQQDRFTQARSAYEGWLAWMLPIAQHNDLALGRSEDHMREGKKRMDAVRAAMQGALDVENGLRQERLQASERSLANTKRLFVIVLAAAAFVLALLSRRQLSSIAAIFRTALDAERQSREQAERESWIRAGQAKLGQALQAPDGFAALGKAVLATLAPEIKAEVGAFFALDIEGRTSTGWVRQAGYGLDSRAAGPAHFALGEGLVGRAASSAVPLLLQDLPPDFLKLRSGTGERDPSELVLLPARVGGRTMAVVEFGFLGRLSDAGRELLVRVAEPIGLAVRSLHDQLQVQELLEETQRQAEELQTQQEELRVSNEELESQASVLRSSQAQLETQQAELEQTNEQLGQQTELLERQNLDLARSRQQLEVRSLEIERASRFKSEFLSNMSHELRTPLNSSLILAKLLAENRNGNLTDEQVQFAESIYSAGNDLLLLINDVLDLSKVEAGKLEIHAAILPLHRLRDTLARTFEPMAKEKGLHFDVVLTPGLPETLETDPQRLEQVLKNLIANALKFTERGEVVVEIARREESLAFAVRDTGLGIAPENQRIIFEAFRQLDANTNRKYSGTGLGLSISRELAALLGGEITVASVPGQGSTFTLVLPTRLSSGLPKSRAQASLTAQPSIVPVPTPVPVSAATQVDLPVPGQRLMLTIEDDEAFAKAVKQIAEDAGFQCLIASTALQGFQLAKKHRPIGIILDVGLPDYSGLSVLDRLKRDPDTRHIPVHIISVNDHSEAALSMGAVAYLLKPVEGEKLRAALKSLERRSAQRLRRVLVVEDDAALRESVAKLLEREDVEIVTAATVDEALTRLRERTFDCLVTDLTLPGRSGYDLLETMASQDEYPVPPVIVYTGQALSADQEQSLRRYSRSIIVKGAKSPERLLDEVTLFLHQVESELSVDQQRTLREVRRRESALEGRTVLVVEDDVRNIFALTSALEPRGAKVAIARNGKEALAVLERLPQVDLVLMDLMMPEMDGLSAMREIRRQPQWAKLPMIALTAKAMSDDRERSLAAGANDYLAKPFDMEMLLSLLRVWMPAR